MSLSSPSSTKSVSRSRSKSKSKSKRKSRSKSKSKLVGSTKKSTHKKSAKPVADHYQFKIDSLCAADSDGRCDVELLSTEHDVRDELQCKQCTNTWNEGEVKYCCTKTDCSNTFCERCVVKDKSNNVKHKRSSKRRHKTPSTKGKKSRFESSEDGESNDEYKTETPSTSIETSVDSDTSSNHNHKSKSETTSTTSSDFRSLVKKKSLFSSKQITIRTTSNCMDTDESMNDNDSIASTTNNRKRKLNDKCEEDEPPHKKMKICDDKKVKFNAKIVKQIIEDKNKNIETLCELNKYYKKRMEEYKTIAMNACHELKVVKAEGLKCVDIINGLRKDRELYKQKCGNIMAFFKSVEEPQNEEKEDNEIVNEQNTNHVNANKENTQEIAQNVDESNANPERDISVEDGEIVDNDDIKTNALNTSNINNGSNDEEALDVTLSVDHRPLQKRKKKKALKEEQNGRVPNNSNCTTANAVNYNVVNGIVDLTADDS